MFRIFGYFRKFQNDFFLMVKKVKREMPGIGAIFLL